mmetsp:Transcript_150128/g.482535  ORF Transcript_150128/g.482535 Transcript_150128/m.482535 type:complete len:209 (-) Transcript_150128:1157-1783(-)
MMSDAWPPEEHVAILAAPVVQVCLEFRPFEGILLRSVHEVLGFKVRNAVNFRVEVGVPRKHPNCTIAKERQQGSLLWNHVVVRGIQRFPPIVHRPERPHHVSPEAPRGDQPLLGDLEPICALQAQLKVGVQEACDFNLMLFRKLLRQSGLTQIVKLKHRRSGACHTSQTFTVDLQVKINEPIQRILGIKLQACNNFLELRCTSEDAGA